MSWWICFLQTHIFSSQDINWWTGVVWIIVMFLSADLTLILTAPIHFHWWASDVMLHNSFTIFLQSFHIKLEMKVAKYQILFTLQKSLDCHRFIALHSTLAHPLYWFLPEGVRIQPQWYFNCWFECANHSRRCVYSLGISRSARERLNRTDQGQATNTGLLERQRELHGVSNPITDVMIRPLWNAIRNWWV